MSVIYCEVCGIMVDTDFDLSHCEGEDCDGATCECNPDCPGWSDEDRQEWAENEAYLRQQRRHAALPTMNELRAESEQAKIAERQIERDAEQPDPYGDVK